MNTQVSFKRTRSGFMLMGSDRLSQGVMVGGSNLLEAYDQLGRQLEVALTENHNISASVRCTIDRKDFESYLEKLDAAVILFEIDTWR